MKSADGLAFEPMFSNRSLDWSDTKNVMFWDGGLSKYANCNINTDLFPNLSIENPEIMLKMAEYFAIGGMSCISGSMMAHRIRTPTIPAQTRGWCLRGGSGVA